MREPPSTLKNNAHKRFYENEDHYFTTISIADSDKPLLADDKPRAIARVMAVIGVDEATAERIVEYGSMKMNLSESAEGSGAERIVGATTDFLGIAFLDRARAAANSVARIVTRDLRPLATGFLISDRLLITNNHVFATPAQASEAFIEFYYELDIGRNPRAISRFRLAPDQFFLTNDKDDLDYTVVAVGPRVAGAAELAEFGYLPLSDDGDKHMLGEYVNIIEHPEGDYKQAVLRENQLVWRLDHVLHYMADTNPGSSGSPVFNDEFRVVALHHWGEPHRDMPGKGTREINEGIRISAIVAGLKAATGLSGPQRSLLDAALSLQENALPITARPVASATSVDSTQPVVQDGTATWTIPITVSLRVGDLPTAPATAVEPAAAQATPAAAQVPTFDLFGGEKVTIDENFANRSGYSETFLPGFTVALPKLNAALKHDAVPLLNPPAGADATVLKYEHFSLQMSKAHRMAYYTASNIDGGSWLWLIRGTGAVKAGFNSDNSRESLDGAEGAESGGETWFIDKRIEVKFQTNQKLYDHQKLTVPDPGGKIKRAFDRGHLTRRQEPSWGSIDRARRAEADTFHFTNCTPQLVKFNESAQFWQGIEQYVLDNATVENERINVYTGPVFRPDDPKYRDVHVPMQFWKIVARVEGGKLKATALLADQTSKIEEQPDGSIKLGTGGSESFDDLGRVKQYQTSVKKIEELAGLNFGALAEADTLHAGPEALGAEAIQRELTAFTDIRL